MTGNMKAQIFRRLWAGGYKNLCYKTQAPGKLEYLSIVPSGIKSGDIIGIIEVGNRYEQSDREKGREIQASLIINLIAIMVGFSCLPWGDLFYKGKAGNWKRRNRRNNSRLPVEIFRCRLYFCFFTNLTRAIPSLNLYAMKISEKMSDRDYHRPCLQCPYICRGVIRRHFLLSAWRKGNT